MSLSDKIAKSLIAGGWFTEAQQDFEEFEEVNYRRSQILLGNIQLNCLIADSPDLQVQGLQGHSALGPYDAMVFPNSVPRRVAFHMGCVEFPIDMIFVGDDSRVTKIVANIEPGERGQWGMPHTVMVIEVNAGFCEAHGIEVGTDVGEIDGQSKSAGSGIVNIDEQTARKFFPGAVEALSAIIQIGPRIQWYILNNQLGACPDDDKNDGTYDSEMIWTGVQWEECGGLPMQEAALEERMAQETFPNYPRKDINPAPQISNPTHDRFKNHDVVDKQVDSPTFSPLTENTDGGDLTIDVHDEDSGIGPSVRAL